MPPSKKSSFSTTATMHPLWISKLMLLVLICFSTSVTIPVDSAVLEGGTATDCKSVPYPFGLQGALPGFEVVCTSMAENRTDSSILPTGSTTSNSSTAPSPSSSLTGAMNPALKLPSGTYLIQSISLQGQVSIFAGPIYQLCYDNGTQNLKHGNGWLDLSGTPFTLSKNYTTFVAVGCDDVVTIEGVFGDGHKGYNRAKQFKSGCVAFCSNYSSLIDGSCTGIGCCQMELSGGLKKFQLNFYRIQNTGVGQLSNCGTGFFTTRDDFSFSSSFFYNHRNNSFRPTAADHVIVLNWAIGNESCEEAAKDPSSFACKSNSNCSDSPTGVGYLCNCTKGYQGNPYVTGARGCVDINECLSPATNPCSGLCVNLEGGVACKCPPGSTGDGRKDGSGCKKQFPTNIALGICLALVVVVATAIFCSYSRLQKRTLLKMRSEFFRQNGGWILQQRLASQAIDATTKIFTEEQLQRATDNYSESRILGRGGYGTVYKGVLSNQQVVAIKRSKIIDESQVEQFVNEITILSQINHRNVVRLLGCCLETQVPLLVYEFISNGTLFEHIHHNQNILSWEDRLRVARETALAIAYLHSAASFPIIHRDIKSSNILLDEKYTAKVSDFGASRSVPFDQTHITTLVQGTLGYLDPEYFYNSQLTEKSDVYSFGVVLAELLTGEMPVSFERPEDCRNLATYFASLVEDGHLIQAIERRVLAEAKLDEIYYVAHLARKCLNVKGEERPSMKLVALELEGLTRFTKRSAGTKTVTEKERSIDEVGSTSTVSEASEISRQYSLECQLLSNTEYYPR